jgi:SAM-dependent methyltransferase
VVAEHLRVPRGGRVLDLGGGAAWVSELLAKLGYRPFTLDLALPLLRVGRDRFPPRAPDRALHGGRHDGAAVPRRARFDAVVVIDALHHVPDVPAVFREAHRVLAEGGQFLLAEPGEGHAESEKVARRARRPRRVRAGDPPAGGRSLRPGGGLHHQPAGAALRAVARRSTPPSCRAWRRALDTWRLLREDGAAAAFDEFLCSRSTAIRCWCSRKGARPLDSRLPRQLKARIAARARARGTRVRGRVSVQNDGDTRWIRGEDEPGCVRLGIQLMTPDRRLLQLDFARACCRTTSRPGAPPRSRSTLTLPDAARGYVLKLDLVDEQICWFEDVGSRPVYVAV